MRSICVLGNSHVACLKAAWDGMTHRHDQDALCFFASPKDGLRGLKLAGSALEPQNDALRQQLSFTSGGRDRVVPADYDAFLLVGLGFRLPAVDRRLSAAVRAASLRGRVTSSLIYKLAWSLRQLTSRPIYVAATPCLPERRLQETHLLSQAAMAAELTGLFAAEKLHFLPQPRQTLDGEWRTKVEFAREAPRLAHRRSEAGKYYEEGQLHMNSDYGRIYLDCFLEVLEQDTAPTAAALP